MKNFIFCPVVYFGDFLLNPFVPNAPFRYPLKTSENCKGRERVHWEQMGLMKQTCVHFFSWMFHHQLKHVWWRLN